MPVPRQRSVAGSRPPDSPRPSAGLGRQCHLHAGTQRKLPGTPDLSTVLSTAPTTHHTTLYTCNGNYSSQTFIDIDNNNTLKTRDAMRRFVTFYISALEILLLTYLLILSTFHWLYLFNYITTIQLYHVTEKKIAWWVACYILSSPHWTSLPINQHILVTCCRYYNVPFVRRQQSVVRWAGTYRNWVPWSHKIVTLRS